MSTQPITSQYNLDSEILQKNLDQKRSAILVVERGHPEPIMTLEGYVFEENLDAYGLNRNRVRCSLFGDEEQNANTTLTIFRFIGVCSR